MRCARSRSAGRCTACGSRGPRFWLVIAGAAIALATIAAGEATVLYTFYPPLTGSPFYYLGVLIAVVGSWIWIGLMVSHFARWKRDHPGLPVPLAMFATTAGALLWAWTSLGVGAEIVFLILPNAFGWTATIDAGLARLLFSWTLHAIVYFWLIPAYIAFYVLLPQAAGGRLYSDKMGRIAFLLLLVFSMPIGFHHLFADPQVGAGFKFIHTVFTGMVAVPTLLTIFTICASLEIAGRLRGGRGLFGWIACVALGPAVRARFGVFAGDAGPRRRGRAHQHELCVELDGPQHAVGHRSLPPDLRGLGRDHVLRDRVRALAAPDRPAAGGAEARSAAAVDLVHRHAGHDAAVARGRRHGAAAAHGLLRLMPIPRWHRRRSGSAVSAVGGFVLVFSALLLIGVLIASQRTPATTVPPLTFALAVHPPRSLPRSLNSFGVWMLLVVALTVANYGYPLAQSLLLKNTGVAAISGAGAMTTKRRSAIRDLDRRHRRAVSRRGGRSASSGCRRPSPVQPSILWTTICRAVGLPIGTTQASLRGEGQPASDVAWTTATRDLLAHGDAARGAAIATTCNNCHGANGISADAAFPSLAGQSVAALYKQLEDYKSGKRDPAIMGVYVAPLSQQQMLDLATHFASLPNPFAVAAAMPGSTDTAARNLIEVGSPMRGIASCAACHGPLGLTPGAPELRGQQRAYLEEQMQAFKAGNRHNDISEQMRSVARPLTGEEIAMLAAYYSSFAGPTSQRYREDKSPCSASNSISGTTRPSRRPRWPVSPA